MPTNRPLAARLLSMAAARGPAFRRRKPPAGRLLPAAAAAVATLAAAAAVALVAAPAAAQVFRRGQHAWSPPTFVPPPERDGGAANGGAAAAALPTTPLAIFIQAAGSNVGHLPRLLSRVHDAGNVYAIHVDAKVPADTYEPIAAAIRANPAYTNVHLMPRSALTYLGISLVLNTLSAARHFLMDTGVPWTYFINISASDYPLVSADTMRTAFGGPDLQAHRLSFVQNFLGDQHLANIRKFRLNKLTFDPALAAPPDSTADTRLAQTGLDNPLGRPSTFGLRYAAAEAWMALHRDFVVEAVTGDLGRQLLALLAPSLVPEEHYFAMLAANHPDLSARTAPDGMRGVVWEANGRRAAARPFYVDEVNATTGEMHLAPRVLSMSTLFVRKMRDADNPLMDRIDAESAGFGGAPADHAAAVATKRARVHARVACHVAWHVEGRAVPHDPRRRPCAWV